MHLPRYMYDSNQPAQLQKSADFAILDIINIGKVDIEDADQTLQMHMLCLSCSLMAKPNFVLSFGSFVLKTDLYTFQDPFTYVKPDFGQRIKLYFPILLDH